MRSAARVAAWMGSAGSAMLMLAACSSTPLPTAASTTAATATVKGAQVVPSSGVIRGQVTDAAGRPLVGANVECTSNAQCTLYGDVSAQDGVDQGVKTNANGYYQLKLTRAGEGAFSVNASAAGYQIQWRDVQLPDPACTWDQPGCGVTVNFALTVAPE